MITCSNLVAALDADFAGVGAPEQTEIFTMNWTDTYLVRDRRFGIVSHTHQCQAEMPPEKALRQAVRIPFWPGNYRMIDRQRRRSSSIVRRRAFCQDMK
jgi:hypothetical protein